MDDNSSTAEQPRETTPSSVTTRKRPGPDGFRRGKRGKYTSVAWYDHGRLPPRQSKMLTYDTAMNARSGS